MIKTTLAVIAKRGKIPWCCSLHLQWPWVSIMRK